MPFSSSECGNRERNVVETRNTTRTSNLQRIRISGSSDQVNSHFEGVDFPQTEGSPQQFQPMILSRTASYYICEVAGHGTLRCWKSSLHNSTYSRNTPLDFCWMNQDVYEWGCGKIVQERGEATFLANQTNRALVNRWRKHPNVRTESSLLSALPPFPTSRANKCRNQNMVS